MRGFIVVFVALLIAAIPYFIWSVYNICSFIIGSTLQVPSTMNVFAVAIVVVILFAFIVDGLYNKREPTK